MYLNIYRLDTVDLERFVYNDILPFGNRHFFARHFSPYVLIKDLCREKKILEIGFGDGYGLHYLSEFVKERIGIDMKHNNCIRARQKYNLENLLTMNGVDLGFKKDVF